MTDIGRIAGAAVTVERIHTIPTCTASEFGKPIPTGAQVDCLELMISWGCPPRAADSVVREAAGLLERDVPDAAIRTLMTLVDLTGAYRILAMMAVAT